MYPYAHPQHLKLLKHFVYIQYGCGMQSMGVSSLKTMLKHVVYIQYGSGVQSMGVSILKTMTLQHHTGLKQSHAPISWNPLPPIRT